MLVSEVPIALVAVAMNLYLVPDTIEFAAVVTVYYIVDAGVIVVRTVYADVKSPLSIYSV